MTEEFNGPLADLADDLEQILAAESDRVFDLSPLTERWLLAALDELSDTVVLAPADR
jgi:hypothetical protein